MSEKPSLSRIEIGGAIAVAFLVAVYWAKPDGMAALTIWPAWIPFAIIACICLARARRQAWKRPSAQALGIAAAGLSLMDSPLSLIRGELPAELTVVSLNCAGGIPAAMKEVAAFQPDIILLQERPDAKQIREFAKKIYKAEHIAFGPDAAIISRWPITKANGKPTTANMNHSWATVAHPKGEIAVCSLRLQPPIFRLDLWSSDAWQTYARNKAQRRIEILGLLRNLPHEFEHTAHIAILGGDYNTPADATLTHPISQLGFTDSFAEHGIGLGGTAVNDYPAVRIDQVWVRGLQSRGTRAVKTVHSDHRMVVAKFSIPASK